jgi:hypothetical protein
LNSSFFALQNLMSVCLIGAFFNASCAEYASGFSYVAAFLLVNICGLSWANAFANTAFGAFLLVFIQTRHGDLFERSESAE